MQTISIPDTDILLEPDNSEKVEREARARVARQQQLGLFTKPDHQFDELALHLARTFDTEYAMVNLVGVKEQFFTGLWATAPDKEAAEAINPAPPIDENFRTMDIDTGYCPHVVQRRKTLVLNDVCAMSRFQSNAVVARLDIRAYAGVPFFARDNEVLGTICVVSTRKHDEWDMDTVHKLRELSAETTDLVYARAGQRR